MYSFSTGSGGDDTKAAACWNCKEVIRPASVFCGVCESVQPPLRRLTYFDVMGIDEARYDVDLDTLEKRYRALQRKVHPDKFRGSSDQEQRYSVGHATVINEAYRTLRDPVERARYLLTLVGATVDPMAQPAPEMLLHFLELQDEVRTASAAELPQLKLDHERRLAAALESFRVAFSEGDHSAARDAVVQLNFVERVGHVIHERMDAH